MTWRCNIDVVANLLYCSTVYGDWLTNWLLFITRIFYWYLVTNLILQSARTMDAANCAAVLLSVPISYHFHCCTAQLVALVVVSGAPTHLFSTGRSLHFLLPCIQCLGDAVFAHCNSSDRSHHFLLSCVLHWTDSILAVSHGGIKPSFLSLSSAPLDVDNPVQWDV